MVIQNNQVFTLSQILAGLNDEFSDDKGNFKGKKIEFKPQEDGLVYTAKEGDIVYTVDLTNVMVPIQKVNLKQVGGPQKKAANNKTATAGLLGEGEEKKRGK